VFHLRGNQRTSGEASRKEGGKIFGSGSRAPIAITLLVKNPLAVKREIRFHDIGDYLSREEKLERIASYGGISGAPDWKEIFPDEHGDWLKQRDDGFSRHVLIARKPREEKKAVFASYSMGVKTNRDDWVYDASKSKLRSRVHAMVEFFNREVERYKAASTSDPSSEFVNRDKTRIKWTSDVLGDVEKGRNHPVEDNSIVKALYRPYSKQWLYSSKTWNWSRHLMPAYFPSESCGNLVICVPGAGTQGGFSVLVTDTLPDLSIIGVGQCFPLYLYDEVQQQPESGLFSNESGDNPRRRDAITDAGLDHFLTAYPAEKISKGDLFHYIYGILHSTDYRERYADNLSKELPRIPRVRTAQDFWRFSKAGFALAALHLGYETVDRYPLTIKAKGPLTDADYRVEKMKFAKKKDPETGRSVNDRRTVIYNSKITLSGIPEAAWDYVVNGKAALDWVMERQAVRFDKDSGIVNDANDWAIETMKTPRYALELFQRIVTVSLETQKIVASLPPLDIREDG
jgi:predicted helicase